MTRRFAMHPGAVREILISRAQLPRDDPDTGNVTATWEPLARASSSPSLATAVCSARTT